MVSYDKLWKMLSEKGISKTELKDRIGVSNATFAKFGKNEPVNLKYIDRICRELDCKIEDVVEVFNEKKSKFKSEINVKDLIDIFEDMAKRESLLAGGKVTQEDLLNQITGTIIKASMKN